MHFLRIPTPIFSEIFLSLACFYTAWQRFPCFPSSKVKAKETCARICSVFCCACAKLNALTMSPKGLDITRLTANLKKNYNSFKTKHVSASLLPSSVVNYKAIWKWIIYLTVNANYWSVYKSPKGYVTPLWFLAGMEFQRNQLFQSIEMSTCFCTCGWNLVA